MSKAFTKETYYAARKGEPPVGTDFIYGMRRGTLRARIAEVAVTDQRATKDAIADRAEEAGVRREGGKRLKSSDISFLEQGVLDGFFVQVRQDGSWVEEGDEPPYYFRLRKEDEPVQTFVLRPESGLERSKQNANR